MLTHVKELVEQNAAALLRLWPDADVGIYSAGLNRKELGHAITVAGIQSIYKKHAELGRKDLIIIDECHLLSSNQDSMYRTLLDEMININPAIKVIGFTATPYRTKGGALTGQDNALFTDVCIDVNVKDLVDDGYLSPLISKSGLNSADLSGVKKTAGDFNKKQMEKVFDQDEVTEAALNEVFKFSGERKKWIIFCSGVEHSRHVAQELRRKGISAESITGDTKSDERDSIITAFKRGEIQAITNCDVLTTGFDAPDIDLIVMLRGTHSPGLYVQMLGRGMRLAPDKENCLVLDFAGNIERFGPIDLIKVDKKRKSGISVTPMKVCDNPECRAPNFCSARICCECGHEFKIDETPKHDTTASGAALLSGQFVEPTRLDVSSVNYKVHMKRGGKRSLRVSYRCGLVMQDEWVCVEHEGGVRAMAENWWARRTGSTDTPKTAFEAVARISELKEPKAITIKKSGKYTRIVGYEFD